MTDGPRRIVTGFVDGRSSVLSVDHGGAFLSTGADGGIHELWTSDPAHPAGRAEREGEVPAFSPPRGGTSCRIVRIPPDAERWSDPAAASRAAAAIGAGRPAHWSERHPGMHVTETIDYVLMLEGEVTAVMESGEVDMVPGDILVQRATPHAWMNRSDRPAVLFVTMIGLAEPAPRGASDSSAQGKEGPNGRR